MWRQRCRQFAGIVAARTPIPPFRPQDTYRAAPDGRKPVRGPESPGTAVACGSSPRIATSRRPGASEGWPRSVKTAAFNETNPPRTVPRRVPVTCPPTGVTDSGAAYRRSRAFGQPAAAAGRAARTGRKRRGPISFSAAAGAAAAV